ncbi:MAG: two-component system response regulator, partial [Candidatus Contendobacter sp.]|nr:two-component system response regulator [Candidatus Contendobacter sp.]
MVNDNDTSDSSNLLLVDDDAIFCRVLAQALTRRGFAVSTAHASATALLAVQT